MVTDVEKSTAKDMKEFRLSQIQNQDIPAAAKPGQQRMPINPASTSQVPVNPTAPPGQAVNPPNRPYDAPQRAAAPYMPFFMAGALPNQNSARMAVLNARGAKHRVCSGCHRLGKKGHGGNEQPRWGAECTNSHDPECDCGMPTGGNCRF
jgi:hypothetical protein